jgi:hypothetical protein
MWLFFYFTRTVVCIHVTGATSFLFTEYQYVGVFMIAFAILIFLFLGSVEGFSTKSQPCTYDQQKLCKPALATAIFSTASWCYHFSSFLLGAITCFGINHDFTACVIHFSSVLWASLSV